MAKKAPQPNPLYAAAETKRRHLHLILPKLLETKALLCPFDMFRLEAATKALAHWADMAESQALDHKEVSLGAEFIRIIFCDALGYKSRTDSPDGYHIEREFTVPGAGAADGAIGSFAVGKQMRAAALIECKGIAADLDHDKSSGRTPVQQLWDYLSELPEAPWGILTNYRTIRLYHHSSPRRAYQEFTVQDFRDPQRVRQFLYLFGPEGLLGSSISKPLALELVTGSIAQQRAVGDELYELYRKCRDEIIGLLMEQKSYTQDQAIHAAQKLIDRVVFMAFAQDRGLLPHKLIELTYSRVAPLDPRENPRWQNFINAFRAIDKGHKALDLPQGYNGKLFEPDNLVDDLQLEDEPWTNFFLSMGKYDFRDEGEVNVEVLGNLFERSITELEKRRTVGLFGKQAERVAAVVMPKSAERKRFGIYYTPPEFTHFIVEQTLGRLIAERVEEQATADAQLAALKRLKVVDPACGSGAFLVAAYDRIEEAYDRIIYTLRQEGRLEEAATLERNYGDDILKDNLYGMDLSEQAIEIARLALWLRSARKARRLVDLSGNVVQGNSLVSDPAIHPRAQEWKDTFPAVFASGGFDCVIGNPPWEKLSLKKREFFALAPEILGESNADEARKLIDALEQTNPELASRWREASSSALNTLAYVRKCERYPLAGRGDVNTYLLFAELSRQLVSPDGLIGLLVPSGIATDDTTKHFFSDLMEKKALHALYDFENKERIFADVHRAIKFSVLLINGANRQTTEADFVFFAHSLEDLKPRDRRITLSARDMKLLNPNTRTCPIFRSRFDCELTKRIYRNVPILMDENRKSGGNPWGTRLTTMFHQSADAGVFCIADKLKDQGGQRDGNCWNVGKKRFLPCYEAKMVQSYDHRAAHVHDEQANWLRRGQTDEVTLVEHQNPEFVVLPRWWVDEAAVTASLGGTTYPALLSFRKVTSPTNTRTMLASFIPFVGLVDSSQVMLFDNEDTLTSWRRRCCLLGNLNSYAYDYLVRQKIGGVNLNFFIVKQIPTFAPDTYDQKCPWDKKQMLEKWVSERVLKLTCTADDMRLLAEAASFEEGVHKWNETERAQLRAELDAAYFLLYGLARDEVNYVLDQFQGVTKQDKAHGGPGQTRSAILAAYDELGAR